MFQQFGVMPHEFRSLSADDWAFDMEIFTSRADNLEKWSEAAVKRLEERLRNGR
jgi:hypothetical protein